MEIGNKPIKAGTYERPQRNEGKPLEADEIKKLEEKANQAYASLKEIVRTMLLKQTGEDIKVQSDKSSLSINIQINIDIAITESSETEDNNFWGVQETAARIVDFAKAISGGDPSKIELMRNAFKDGFAEAKKIFGGSLPQISKDTFDEFMRLFEEWEAGDTE